MLAKAAKEIEDRVLEAAVENVKKSLQPAKTGHQIQGVRTYNNSQFLGGDTIAPGMESQAGTGASHSITNIETYGNSQSQCGNRFGGVEFFTRKHDFSGKAQDQDDAKGEEQDDEAGEDE